MLQQIQDVGAFTQRNKNAVNANFQALQQIDVWVRPQYGNNNGNGSVKYPHGSYENPFATMAGLANVIEPGLVIGLEGVLKEEYSSPRVNDVTIIGAASNLPRQATSDGAPNGGGATWVSPTGGTGALLQPNGQGWLLQNIFMNNSATSAGCVKLVNAGDPPTANCSEKFSAIGCIFTGSDDGIAATDLPNNVLLQNCTFFGFAGAGDLAISSATGAGTGTLSNWVIKDCTFNGNTGHITAGFASSEITGCKFSYIYGATTSTTQVVLTNGSNNSVHHNYFDIPYNTNGITAMFALGTNDRWYMNSFATAVTTTIFSFGAPSS